MINHCKSLLLFGASGAIGLSVAERFIARGWKVIGVSRSPQDGLTHSINWVILDPKNDISNEIIFDDHASYDAVCWAQGANLNDSVYDVDEASHLGLYKVNCLFIITTLKLLLKRQLLTAPARLCIVSSIWQNLAKQNKLSYAMTKAALQGLVLSAATDLAVDGHLVNAVLPGALDTPMTRQNLSTEQINKLTAATQFARLPQLSDVANLIYFLCSEDNSGITGQFIAADLGFSHARIL